MANIVSGLACCLPKCFQFGLVHGLDLLEVVDGVVTWRVVGFKGFDACKANASDQAQTVIDGVAGLVLVVVLGLRVTVVLVEPEVRCTAHAAEVAGVDRIAGPVERASAADAGVAGELIPKTSVPSLENPRSSPMFLASRLRVTSPGASSSTRNGAPSRAVVNNLVTSSSS